MHKKKIYIYGKHGKRTPFSYPEYRDYFIQYFDYVNRPEEAEYLITGFRIDFINNAKEIHHLIRMNPSLKLVVFSEEPLWDTLWSGDFQKPQEQINCKMGEKDIILNYHVLNHVTSNIFDFENIPYFITTNNDFHIRYTNFFSRNSKLSVNDFNRNWENAKIRYAFYAAKRIEEKYDVNYQNNSIIGLNRYRSLISEGLDLKGVVREGEGWGAKQKRQALPDWHLDKLAALDGKSFIVSSLENTHLSNYVSEKLFDSFAVQAIPISYTKANHGTFRLIEDGSFINVAELSAEEAIEKIKNFVPDKEFIDKYHKTQVRLAKLFSDPKIYLNERKRVVYETINAFSKI